MQSQVKHDILICHSAATGGELAGILKEGLIKLGYAAAFQKDAVGDPAVIIPIYSPGVFDDRSLCTILNTAVKNGKTIVPVWFNGTKDWSLRQELKQSINFLRSIEISTLDFLGTDFNRSLVKMTQRFPVALKERSEKICLSRQTGDWFSPLLEQPELADHPEYVSRDVLAKLSDIEWAYLLLAQPTLFDRCDWNLIKNNSYIWRMLLVFRPEVAGFANWRTLTGHDWMAILALQPQFASHCQWNRITSLQWIMLLAFRPEFASHCNFMGKLGSDIDADSYLRDYPRFPCPLSMLLMRHPEFADRCDMTLLTGESIVGLLLVKPELSGMIDWRRMDGKDWSKLLSRHPEFARNDAWEKLNATLDEPFGVDLGWLPLIENQPQFIEHCLLSKLTTQDWIKLLIKHPEYSMLRDRKSKLDENNRVGMDWEPSLKDLLLLQPNLVDECEVSSLKAGDWVELLDKHLRFLDICDINAMPVADAMMLLAKFPALSDKCDWARLSGAKEWQWRKLLTAQPQFLARCPIHLPPVENVVDEADNESVIDVYVCLRSGVDLAERLKQALESRGYSVHINSSGQFESEEKEWLSRAKFFFFLRMNGVFDNVLNPADSIRLQLEMAVAAGKQIIVVAPTEDVWTFAGTLPKSIEGIATEQVKNLDTGDLFEEKVDALVRESMIGTQGSLSWHYDIFISYRRSTGARFARRVHQRLAQLGYVAFLDYDSILNGKYDKVIINAVDSAPVFLMLLTDNSLDRCTNPEDWVAAEIRMAHDKGKCIVPITPSDQNWTCPDNLPEDMRWVKGLRKIVIDDDLFNKSLSQIESLFPDDLKTKIADIKTRLQGSTNIFGQQTECDWEELLVDYPDLINICPVDKLSLGSRAHILSVHPYLARKLNCKFDQFYPDVQVSASGIEGKIEKRWRDQFWAELLEGHPEYADLCEVSRLNGQGWASLVRNRPEFAVQCDWRTLDACDRASVLQRRPELINCCPTDDFDASDWCELLKEQPQFATRCEWCEIEELYEWDAISIAEMLVRQPQLAQNINWGRMQGKSDGKDAFFWVKVLSVRPELQHLCKWTLLYDADSSESQWAELSNAWADLLTAQPQFEDRCDWNKLSLDDWEAINECLPDMARRHAPPGKVVKESPNNTAAAWKRCVLAELSRCEWLALLKRYPKLVDIYHQMSRGIKVNRVHYDRNSQIDDFLLERRLAKSYNQLIKKQFSQELTYAMWTPSRRLRVKGVTFKGQLAKKGNDIFYSVRNDLDQAGEYMLTSEDVDLIPGLLSEVSGDRNMKGDA